MVLAANVWHWWIGVVLSIGALITLAVLMIGYLQKVQAPQYRRPRRG